MEIFVLDKEFKSIAIVDYFESVIWTDRFSSAGDFEIYTPATKEIIDILKQDYYLWLKDTEHMMIIESVKLTTDIETGNHLTVSGRSLESILFRRIIWNQTIISGNLQDAIKNLINDAIINPNIETRKIENFIFEDTDDPEITSLSMESAQYTGDNLYEVICALCEAFKIGFKITLNNENNFVFKLYKGKNRSYDQNEFPYVVFSPNFENIVNSNYAEDAKEFKNITLVAGEGEGSARRTITYGTDISGIERRELFTDARDISSEVDGGKLSDEQYNAQLSQRGKEKLEEHKLIKLFDGQTETRNTFQLDKDFFLGDIVQLMNEYGMSSKSKITEIIRSQSDSGYDVYPTFEIVQEETNK